MNVGYTLWLTWMNEYRRSEGLSYQRLGLKRLWLSFWFSLAHSHSFSLITWSGGSKLPCSDQPCGEAHMSCWGTDNLSSKAGKDLKDNNSHKRELGRGFKSWWLKPWPTDWLQPHERLWAGGTHAKQSWIPDSHKLWVNKCLSFSDANLTNSLCRNISKETTWSLKEIELCRAEHLERSSDQLLWDTVKSTQRNNQSKQFLHLTFLPPADLLALDRRMQNNRGNLVGKCKMQDIMIHCIYYYILYTIDKNLEGCNTHVFVYYIYLWVVRLWLYIYIYIFCCFLVYNKK